MSDRYVDNADFFSVEEPEAIADQELYDLMTTECWRTSQYRG